MKIIIPTGVTSSMVSASTAVNADADYAPATTYVFGAKVTFENYIYKSLQNGNLGNQPDLTTSAAWWALQGPANKWAMFDDEVQTQTTATSTLSTTIDASYVNSISCTNIAGSSVTVTVKKDAVTIYTRTLDLADYSLIGDWSDYYFSEHEFQSEFSLTDLPPVPGVQIIVTITKPSNTVAIGHLIIGRLLDVGLEQYGLNREGIDHTIATTDKFGKLTREKQAYARKYSTQAILNNERFDYVSKKLDSIASVPVVCIGGNGFKSTLTVYGLVSYSISLQHLSISYVSIKVIGLI
ncbi:hypothetical protein [Undibacterium baiyunense]|uniref:Carbohydrate binding domain-containing protein n=1 Tax=Undibacterium baiyunense TaxID=2828731 RepID=A0A941DEP1_9BURK|nr:hypothetical protein [Undibacterium baiyunense]MBR7747463.1 hypothetical protein [Undibacterium baiyunense]